MIAKSLVQEPDLIIFDEPTRGVDVGAIVEIHELINRLADEGKAVVVISSYLPEIMALSDRILVSRQGKVVEEFSRARGDRGEDHVRGDALEGRFAYFQPSERIRPKLCHSIYASQPWGELHGPVTLIRRPVPHISSVVAM